MSTPIINRYVMALALAASAVAPALPANAKSYDRVGPAHSAPARDFAGPRSFGQDPDPNIQLELERDPPDDCS